VDPAFAQDLADRQAAWRRVVQLAVGAGIAAPGITNSLAYFDTYRRGRLPANLVQAQRDFFGSHTYERTDGQEGWFHTGGCGAKDGMDECMEGCGGCLRLDCAEQGIVCVLIAP
jgi:6-phosphogluconate dehydrogenase